MHAYDTISYAMVEYLEEFHSSFSFKQKTKAKFCEWLKSIQKTYQLEGAKMPYELEVKLRDMDTGIAMLKELHSREGITKEDLCINLDLRSRAVQKNLRKLSPNLYEGEKENINAEAEYVPFQIGGQPITSEIKIKKNKGDRRPHYYTPNTVHPIVLQENLMQVGALLKSLCHSFYDFESDVSLLIATDIWSQLSDYAKDKIQLIYTINDSDFYEFIEILDDGCPDDHASTYLTEREMAEKIAVRFTATNVFDYIELTEDYAIYEVPVVYAWIGKTISEINIRRKYRINIIAIKVGSELNVLPGSDYCFTEHDHIILIGTPENVSKLAKNVVT